MAELNLGQDWVPTAENVNALPDALRSYIHDLHTRADPAGDVRELIITRDLSYALERQGAELRAALESVEWVRGVCPWCNSASSMATSPIAGGRPPWV